MKSLIVAALSFSLAAPSWAQDVVLARNDWTTVTKADFDTEISRIPRDQQFGFLASAERVGKTVEAILINKTLAAQARADKLHEDPDIKAELASAADKVLARNRIERVEAATKEPDFTKRAEELYRANLKKYAEKDVYHTMHVLVDAKCRTPDAAKARALEARAEIESGKAFAEVAKKYSDD
ncbi:MAG: peptidylprolyl isomerase, partial [Myxococcales bacterium]|nr:peptidylprolyl isomerase [Myxococcales bacterium]